MLDLDMSPYAAFVWPAWGISALVLGIVVARALAASRRWNTELRRLEQGQPLPHAARSAVGDTQPPQAAQGTVGHKK